MLPFKTILHPTDFSKHSEHAFHLACALARESGGRLVLLHVVTPTAELLPTSGIIPPPTAGFVEDVGRQLKEVKPNDPSIPVERRVELGDATEMICTVAEECEADVIVMGTHGRTGLERFVMGSVAEWVLRRAHCPVISVRNPVVALEKSATAEATAAK